MPKSLKTILFAIVVIAIVIYFGAKAIDGYNADRPQEETANQPIITYIASSEPVVFASNAPAYGYTYTAPQAKTVSAVAKTVINSVNTAVSTQSKVYKTVSYTKTASVSTQQQTLGYSIPQGYTRAQISPFYQLVRISSVSPSFYSFYPSQIKLASYFTQKSQRIDITGWKVKSNKNEITIPQAANLYELSGYSVDSDIVLSPNSYVSIYSNSSAVNRNLRINKCMGYLEKDYSFSPSLSASCPAIPRGSIAYLSGQCQAFILSLKTCQITSPEVYNSFDGEDGNKCRTYLSRLNYNSCIKDHGADADFLLNDWRVWVTRQILDPDHDTVSLFDSNGLLVDQYIY